MSTIFRFVLMAIFIIMANAANAQTTVKGKIIDATTKEPIAGASIHCTMDGCKCGCMTDANGDFAFNLKDSSTNYLVSVVGYKAKTVQVSIDEPMLIVLEPSQSLMQEVVVSANREGVKRSQAPIAIAAINQKMLQDAKAISADQVLNKVSGVYMVNLGNEQHQMSIRQPMTTKSLFL